MAIKLSEGQKKPEMRQTIKEHTPEYIAKKSEEEKLLRDARAAELEEKKKTPAVKEGEEKPSEEKPEAEPEKSQKEDEVKDDKKTKNKKEKPLGRAAKNSRARVSKIKK